LQKGIDVFARKVTQPCRLQFNNQEHGSTDRTRPAKPQLSGTPDAFGFETLAVHCLANSRFVAIFSSRWLSLAVSKW
jgi:hypothetical protein